MGVFFSSTDRVGVKSIWGGCFFRGGYLSGGVGKGNVISLFARFMYVLLVLSLADNFTLLFADGQELFVVLSFTRFLGSAIAEYLTLRTAGYTIGELVVFGSGLTR